MALTRLRNAAITREVDTEWPQRLRNRTCVASGRSLQPNPAPIAGCVVGGAEGRLVRQQKWEKVRHPPWNLAKLHSDVLES